MEIGRIGDELWGYKIYLSFKSKLFEFITGERWLTERCIAF